MIRLDAYLQQFITKEHGVELSRTYVEKLLEMGGVKLNNEVIKKKGFKFNSDKIAPVIDEKALESIIIEYQTGKSDDSEASSWSASSMMTVLDPAKLERAGDISPHIVLEDDDILVVYKPPGVLSHPGRGDQNRDSMVYQFAKYMEKIHKYIPRAGLLHRLDLDTRGLLVFAKNMESYNIVKKAFETRKIEKWYLAITKATPRLNNLIKNGLEKVHRKELPHPYEMFRKAAGYDEIKAYMRSLPAFELDGYIGKARDGKKMYFSLDQQILRRDRISTMKNCDSTIAIAGEYNNDIFLFVQPHTGRTHQIRAQAAYLGAPVKNDRLYGKTYTPKGTLGLIACAISFSLKEKQYNIVLPPRYFS
ncbi:MAG: pseudouridine synthase [Candidatus Dojkabacteria bacterium]|nr:MAG: pseudouridine synthase [Candidatus Dojkabacteria bacterium]